MNTYLSLLKHTLTDSVRYRTEHKPIVSNRGKWTMRVLYWLNRLLKSKQFAICKIVPYSHEARLNGRDWPQNAETMIGLKRMDNIEKCVIEICANEIPGDFVECGVWRGGASIWIAACLKYYDPERYERDYIYVCDSFAGLPKPDGRYHQDEKSTFHEYKELSIDQENVCQSFVNYGYGHRHVVYVQGWFKNTLPTIPGPFALIRLDGDMYSSTMDGLTNLYPKLSPGGFCIIDDYGCVPECKEAVDDYRRMFGVTEEMIDIDGWGFYWRKNK